MAAACGDSDPPVARTPASTIAISIADSITLATPAEFSSILAADPDLPLVNVHIPYEDHIDGTDAFIAFDSILESPDLPSDKSAPIALYCRSGNMSGQAAAALADAGYTNVIDLDGGMNAWEAGGNSLVDDSSAADG